MTSREQMPPGPPVSTEAEDHVLGNMLRHNRCIDDVAAVLRADDFYSDCGQKLFTAILDCARGGKPVDMVTLADHLKQRGWLDDVGGYKTVLWLWESCRIPGPAEYYARIVREKATLRRLIHAAGEILQDAYKQDAPASQIVDAAARRISEVDDRRAVGDPVPLDTIMHEAFEAIDARITSGRMPGLTTGLADLDEMTGGFRKGELTLIGARPSRGKTATSLTFSTAGAWCGSPVLFCSCEQGRVELADRILAAHARIDLRAIRSHEMSQTVKDRLLQTRNRLGGLRLHVDDSRRQSARHVARQARRLKRKHGLALVVIDYIGLMAAEERRDRKRYEAVGELARDMRDLAGELQVPVVLLSQLNRALEDRGKDSRPRLSDLRESGDLEQHADLVILLHVPNDSKNAPVWPMELCVEKQRNGPTGVVTARFVKAQMRFADADE